MSAGRARNNLYHERNQLEDAQAILMEICLDLDEISLRMKQAILRTSLVSDVLRPAVDRLDIVREELEQMQKELNQTWNERQKKKWGRG